MKHFIILISIFYSISVAASPSLPSVAPILPGAIVVEHSPAKEKLEDYDITKMKVRDLEKLAGRKLTFKEKIAFKYLQYKLKTEKKSASPIDDSKRGKTAFMLGLFALIGLLIPYFAIASLPLAIIAIVEGNKAKRMDPYDKKAITGVILGWVTLGLIALAVIIVVVVIAAFSGIE